MSEPHVLILAPKGRDAELAAAILREAGLEADICGDLPGLENRIDDSACFAIVTEETLRSADLRGLTARLTAQPAWSDFQFIVLTQRGGGPERNPSAARLAEVLRNVSFLERPFHPTSFISLARTAARGRQRQLEARTRMEELHEGEQRLRTALLAGRLGSWELDLTTWELTASATCKAIFGYAPEETFGYSELLGSIHPDDEARMRSAVGDSVETGADYTIEYRTLWRDGSTHWAAINGRVVHDRDGRKVRLVGVSADITERRTAEESLRRLNETLEARVAARTAELEAAHRVVMSEVDQRERTETLLRQSQKMEAIGQLTGGVAHDFNNLLMAVLGNLDLLRKHLGDDPRAARLIDGALKGAQRGAALTQRLLAFARRQELVVEPRNLSELLGGMTDLLERSLGSSVEFRLDLPATAPIAMVDANQLELAVLNLAVNARDAMPNGGELVIEVEPAPADGDLVPGDYVRLTVSDTGQGMDADTLKKATEPFFSTKGVGKGTGLGLSMIHGLAVQLHGALRLSSEPGQGTRAELWLPAAEAAAVSDAVVPAPPPAAPKEPADPIRARILAVDDDMLIAMSTLDMLEDLGHEVVEANSGPQALEILRSDGPFDLMITDFSMPRMNGAELAEAALALCPGMPILLATGYAELPSGARLELPRLGKPYSQDQLAAEIRKLLAR
ncbi:PAS domain-containing sensor histidine kinase [Antarcticirhabdus aurantiaca]|uniref:PAS domain-containing protein n=1 Tax=Antarcticirhabdus aurantiaca TaxID=2606717 RepID=A0ACD4NN13_9HYPH|nr:PAS domain-containing sensor histidine kinase [Antarcticirhabdus aurantiaca]WAJ28257.1 PAS domain-containing protein [Jeongeuplla avenae]